MIADALRKRARLCGVPDEAIDRAIARSSELLAMWQSVAREQTATGGEFTYDGTGAQRRLLQYPLDPDAEKLSEQHQLFVAPRSMRDVEYGVYLKTCDPWGKPLQQGADD